MSRATLYVGDTLPYAAFLAGKAQAAEGDGFVPASLPDFLFPFQRSIVEWALRKGRAAIFADCGLGKTPMQLVWADPDAQRPARGSRSCRGLAAVGSGPV